MKIQIYESNIKYNNQTPLQIALARDSNKIMELFISKGIDINAKDIIYQNIISSFLIITIEIKKWNLNKNNKTPLHYASMGNSNKIGELLISKGANINAKDNIYQNMI